MSKYYVELEDVIQRLDNAIYCANRGKFDSYLEAMKRLRIAYAETMPTIEIVHCEECKHFNADDYQCENSEVAFDMSGGGDCSASRCRTDFCSFGERKDNE